MVTGSAVWFTHIVQVRELDLHGCGQETRVGLHSYSDDLRVQQGAVAGGKKTHIISITENGREVHVNVTLSNASVQGQ